MLLWILLVLLLLCLWKLKAGQLKVVRSTTTPSFESSSILKVVHINVWSGSTYEFSKTKEQGWRYFGYRVFEFLSGIGYDIDYYPGDDKEHRYEILCKQLKELRPSVVTINEAMPCMSYTSRLANEIGFDHIAHVGVGGVSFPFFQFPNFAEGDAILAHPSLKLKPMGRSRLSGFVFSNNFSINTGDATQLLAGMVTVNAQQVIIGVTHWHAGVLEAPEVMKYIRNHLSPDEQQLGITSIAESTSMRVSEALQTVTLCKELVCAQGGKPLILCGDFNTTRTTPEFMILKQAGFQDYGCDQCTWDPKNRNVQLQFKHGVEASGSRNAVENKLYAVMGNEQLKLDHILTLGSCMNFESSSTVLNSQAPPSDHYGIAATFQIQKKAGPIRE